VNKRKVAAEDRLLERTDAVLRDGYVVVGKGKRDVAVIRIV
jgi:hypothetical protein